MPRITRYVLAELAKVFSVTLSGLTLLLMLVVVAKEAITQSLGFREIALLTPYILPEALRFAVPGTALFAACMVYGRMSSSNEVVALKSAGVSPWRIVSPALVAAFLLSLLAVWLNDLAVSWGTAGVQRTVLASAEEIIYRALANQREYKTKQFYIKVQGVDGRRLIRPLVDFRPGDGPSVTVRADEAQIRCDLERERLVVSFRNSSVDLGDSTHFEVPGLSEREIPLAEVSSGKRESLATPSHQPMRSIPEAIDRVRADLEEQETRMAAKSAAALMTGDFAALGRSGWSGQQRRLSSLRAALNKLRTEPHRRWANGFSCLFFVLIGAPMAIRLQKAEFWAVFAVCFLPILLCYYPLLFVGVDQAKSGDWPPPSAWLANAGLLAWGLWLLRRVRRY